MSENYIEQSIEILQATNDGHDLAPSDLKLVEIAVNGRLSEPGQVAFAELLANVRAGYKEPWFVGIEHMTRDQVGYVYWKGKRVEHYDHDLWCLNGWRERMKADALELARRCCWLEKQGIEVSINTAVITWDDPPDWMLWQTPAPLTR